MVSRHADAYRRGRVRAWCARCAASLVAWAMRGRRVTVSNLDGAAPTGWGVGTSAFAMREVCQVGGTLVSSWWHAGFKIARRCAYNVKVSRVLRRQR